jgi:hypothetical protein
MLSNFKDVWLFFLQDWKDLVLLGVAVISVIIVLLDILKLKLFNKIKWKPVRRSCLALSNVLLCFVAVAYKFSVEKCSYDYYLETSILVSISSIILYWVYKNFYIRDSFIAIGKFTVKKVCLIVAKSMDGESEDEIMKEISIAKKEIKEKAKKEISTVAKNVDKELENL